MAARVEIGNLTMLVMGRRAKKESRVPGVECNELRSDVNPIISGMGGCLRQTSQLMRGDHAKWKREKSEDGLEDKEY
jgi:hypothetical protein